LARFEPTNIGFNGKHADHYTAEDDMIRFISGAKFSAQEYCYMLGFLGNMTSALCCVTMGLLRFLSNATVPVA
jgi:hypothetical protein